MNAPVSTSKIALEAGHTPEPWSVNPENIGPCVFGSEFRMVGECFEDGEAPNAEDEANARRIVACVNACAGVSDAFLTEYKGGIAAALATSKERAKQRDELAAAMRELLSGTDWIQHAYFERARAALAKVSA